VTDYSWPLPASIPVSQPFGSNPGGFNPIGGHTGTDFAAPPGTPVHAPGNGKISFEKFETDPTGADNPYWLTAYGGNEMVLDCGEVAFVFAHLSAWNVNLGDEVKEGDVIAFTGNTGTATSGPHLHFEALPDGWDFYNGTYGRVSPAIYCNNYSAVDGGSVNAAPNQRITGPSGVNGRDAASTSGKVTQTFAGNLVLTFKGFVHGENVQGNDVWFVGFSSGDYFWSGGFEAQDTNNLPDLTPAPAPAPASQGVLGYQRVTGANGVNLRDSPNKNGNIVKTFGADLILDFKGIVHSNDGGPYGDGNDVWFVGKYSNTYAWSGAFTDSGIHDLPDITPTAEPVPSTPVVAKYDFELDFETLRREDGVVVVVGKSPADIGNLQKGNPTANHSIAVIHQFGTPNVDTFESTNAQFSKAGTLVSAYWSVSGRNIRQHVSLADRAYHAGHVGNDYLGVETDPNQDPETILTVRALLIALKAKEGKLATLMLHKNVPDNHTNCGALVNLSKYDTAINPPVPTPPTQPEQTPTPAPTPVKTPDTVPVTTPQSTTTVPVSVSQGTSANPAQVIALLERLLEWLTQLLGIKK
jgi:biotin carboxyl carrier protein